MLIWILLFIALAFIYDLMRSINKNSKKQAELTVQVIEQNKELIKLLSEKQDDNKS